MARFWILSVLTITCLILKITSSYSEEASKPSKGLYAETPLKDFVVDAPWRVESVDTEFPLFAKSPKGNPSGDGVKQHSDIL